MLKYKNPCTNGFTVLAHIPYVHIERKNKRENDSQDYFGRFTSTVKNSKKNSQKWPKIAQNKLFLPKKSIHTKNNDVPLSFSCFINEIL